jgi:gamma-glutamyltranspeptidase
MTGKSCSNYLIKSYLAKFGNHSDAGNPIDGVYDDTYFYHALIEAEKFAYAQRTKMGDVDFVPESLELARKMTTSNYTELIVERLLDYAQPSEYYGNHNIEQVTNKQ